MGGQYQGVFGGIWNQSASNRAAEKSDALRPVDRDPAGRPPPHRAPPPPGVRCRALRSPRRGRGERRRRDRRPREPFLFMKGARLSPTAAIAVFVRCPQMFQCSKQ